MSEDSLAARAAAYPTATVRSVRGSLWRADGQRIRHTWLWPLTLLGPLGVTLLGIILFLMRGQYLRKPFSAGLASGFQVVAGPLSMVHVLALGLGAALLASMIVDIEHRSDTWKAMFALPVSRAGTYVVKFGWCALMLAISSALMSGGYAALMLWQHLGPIEANELVRIGALTWVAALPLLSFQLLLSTSFSNQAVPLVVGIVAPMFGMGMSKIPEWMPWRLMTEAASYSVAGAVPGSAMQPSHFGSPQIVMFGLAEAVFMVVIGAILLARREIR